MKWKKYTIETTTAAEDFMSSMLMDLGIEGIEIEDNIPLSKEDQADPVWLHPVLENAIRSNGDTAILPAFNCFS